MVCSICKQSGHNRRTCDLKQVSGASPHDPSRSDQTKRAGLRSTLPEADLIWEYRNDQDAYSHFTRLTIVDQHPEKDHVFEIQLMDAAFLQYSQLATGAVTRQEKARIQGLANCKENTNITTRDINRSKKGPFTRARNDLLENDFRAMQCPGVDSYFYTRRRNYVGLSPHNWEQVKKEVVASFEAIEGRVESAVHQTRNAELFGDSLRDVFNSLRIEE